ncbi:voltage-gated potassium channel [Calocera viscosa TUFC12733]|uniref:Voltage-gated potassium channel n=1 Tax=Calocera viscosa (strain TUFC12733) TaxID=1330018 RepID=A0A167K517_CALVF|nr:voltage-gated potassium channel [Calocera viscosa TUFC12733]
MYRGLRAGALSTPNLPLTANPFPPSAQPDLTNVDGFPHGPPAIAEDVELQELQPLFNRVHTTSSAHSAGDEIVTPWRKQLFNIMEQPSTSSSAFLVHFLSNSLIIISASLTVLETLPVFHRTPTSVWFGLETGLVTMFTVEYLARVAAHSETWSMLIHWATSFMAIIDLLAILPYYLEIIVHADTTTIFRWSILRTFRLLRMFRAFSHSNTILLTIEVMYISIQRSADALLALSFFVVMILVVFSTLLYFAERGTWDPALEEFIDADGAVSAFSSIPASAWFVMTTITTVGYGDIIPRSGLGRLITVPLLMFGLLVVALPSFVLGRNFSAVWEGMKRRGAIVQARNEATEGGPMGPDPTTPITPNGGAIFDERSADLEVLQSDVRRLTKVVERQGGDLERLIQLLERRHQEQ